MNSLMLHGAICRLQELYDRPQLIFQAHVHAIVEAASLISGSGQKLHHLHDVVQQHMGALQTIKYCIAGNFRMDLIFVHEPEDEN